MKFFDPHIHMTSRTTDDYQSMADAGIAVIVEPAFWVGQPRTHVGTFEDYFLSLLGWERFRASQFGIRHFATIGLNPKEANNTTLAAGVMELLPLYLEKEGVVAVGEIGYDDITPAEETCLLRQIELAKDAGLPILIHTPHRDKKRGTERTLDVVRESGFPPERTLIDHNNEETLASVLDSGCWAGHSIYPKTKMDEPRMVTLVKNFGSERMLVNSAADWGVSDPLKVPKRPQPCAKPASVTTWSKRSVGKPDRVLRAERAALGGRARGQRGRGSVAAVEGNSVLRGQAPRTD
jgi:predicted metal-dependent TIM-barrel fold hydrolase